MLHGLWNDIDYLLRFEEGNMLTPAQTKLQKSIIEAYDARLAADKHYQDLLKNCVEHVYVNVSDDAQCAVCGHNAGWFCPESPNHLCSYDQNEICTFCGCPEERK